MNSYLQQNQLNLVDVLNILKNRGFISQLQGDQLLLNLNQQKTKRELSHRQTSQRRNIISSDALNPAETISSFNLERIDKSGFYLTEDAITEAIASYLSIPYLKIDPLKLDLNIVTSFIPRPFALKNLMVAVEKTGNCLSVAVADPFSDSVLNELASALNIQIIKVLSSKSDILKILREFYGFRATVMSAENDSSDAIDIGNLEQFFKIKGSHDSDGNEKHIISAVDFLLNYAFEQRASDIHIEPKREKSIIRFRLDGIMHNIHAIPKQMHPQIISRIKLLARMDLAEKRRPQDGRVKTTFNNKNMELRVSTVPVAFGEKVVIRIFDPDILLQDLGTIGFYPREMSLYNSFIRRPNGIILVTGPTGSGKTTTLYSTLRTLSSPEVNVVTVEDPIEMIMEEFNQIAVQQAIGVTFDSILRNILRQDPDIIMIGEIRDKETAENAVQAALTGHLVISTLHTNDSPSSIIRLLDLGIPSFLISATLIGIIAQRLVRKICPHCATERVLNTEEAEYLHLAKRVYTVKEGKGCKECRGTGYKGRTGIFEVLDMTENIKKLITPNSDLAELLKNARSEGLLTLRELAIHKMLEGITTYEEVVSMTG